MTTIHQMEKIHTLNAASIRAASIALTTLSMKKSKKPSTLLSVIANRVKG